MCVELVKLTRMSLLRQLEALTDVHTSVACQAHACLYMEEMQHEEKAHPVCTLPHGQ